ncbi:MAG: SusD/RagB family nutrient-binding outer membrane lipoprotein [Cyclobacteriaceae bacterium]|nr:SusD/RagB family nutrient-binding outer membrane lipoprotein [Cyclobacteriaceae bacterium]
MKLLKNIQYKLLIVLLTVGMISCDLSDFGDTNDDPNNTTSPKTSALLTNALKALPWTTAGDNGRNFRAGQHYVQYVGNTQYTGDDNYDADKFDYNSIYTGPLADLKFIIDYNVDADTKDVAASSGSNGNQIAVAKILMSYYYLHLTDRFGDIPYSDALKSGEATQVLSPGFSTQQEVYNGIFSTLTEAVSSMDGGKIPEGDILFGGDMGMWKKFANTIRMVAGLRLSEVDEAKGKAEFTSALSAGVISSNDERIVYQYLAEQNNENPWFSAFRTREDWSMTSTIVDYMNHSSSVNPFTSKAGMMDVIMDPRLPKYANPTEASNFKDYVGQPYGLTEADAGAISNSEVSLLGDYMRTQDLAYPIYSYAQVLFCQAEAAERGWTGGDAQQLYYDAIFASLEEYGVDGDYDQFILNSEVAWDATKAQERIATQKWVAMFLVGYDAWSNWRRTGFPVLQPSPNGILSQTIPTRQAYPDSERDLNTVNWQKAVDNQFGGVDDLNGKVWWDK